MKTDGDDLAWKREFEHVEAKQKQRVVVGSIGVTKQKDISLIGAIKHFYEIKDNNNEINDQ